MLPRIFEMFTQVNRSLERSQGGLGVGLTLVKRLVELHGGTISARSEGPNQGSEFVVRLPVVLPPSSIPDQSDREPAASISALRILVVDDNRDSAASLGMLLRMMGNEVRLAHDGVEAVTAADAFRPDVALLDIGLPGINGYEAARRIRQQPWGQRIMLIATTGWGQESDRLRSKDAGFDHHLVKPINTAVLSRLLAAQQPALAPAGD
jgi:CheY-like chemotaxis protein